MFTYDFLDTLCVVHLYMRFNNQLNIIISKIYMMLTKINVHKKIFTKFVITKFQLNMRNKYFYDILYLRAIFVISLQ